MRRNRFALFQPDPSAPPESATFSLEFGQQLTITGFGLQSGDEVQFEMVHVPALNPDMCACPPGRVDLPSVAAVTPLMCCGTPQVLTPDNPVVIIDSPQRTLLRAVLVAADPENVWVWAVETDTPNLNDRMRGCPCGGSSNGGV